MLKSYDAIGTTPYDPGDSELVLTATDNAEDRTIVESTNPLGQQFGLFSAVMLNVGQILGSGIFSVPGVVLNSVGSVGMVLVYWLLTPLFPLAGMALYTEYASMFPKRSGAEVVYLEKAFPRPQFLVSTTFAAIAILTSFSAANAVIFAQYSLAAFDIPVTSSSQTIVGLGVVVITMGSVALSTRVSLRLVNILSVFKIISMFFIVASGVAVFAGLTEVKDPFANFKNPFEGTTTNGNALSTAFVKTNHSFIGWANAFNILGEIKSRNPVKTARKASFISLMLVSFLFLFINISYISAVSKEDIVSSGQLIAVIFFRRVFGDRGSTILPLMVAAMCFGNIMAVTISGTRVIREVARQGLLPYPHFFSSTRPFGTPIGPVALKGALTALVIFLVPAKDAFNFILDLASYPNMVFHAGLAIGIWKLRKRRASSGSPPSPYQVHNAIVFFYLLICVLLLTLPWQVTLFVPSIIVSRLLSRLLFHRLDRIPPEPGHADVSFWYATYCVAGLGLIAICGAYYYVWIILLPKIGGYKIVEEIEESVDGARNRKLVRRYHKTATTAESSEDDPLIVRVRQV